LSWELGLKANALYRDGCKLSQPLSTKSDSKKEEKIEDKIGEVLAERAELSLDEITPDMVLDAARRIIDESNDTIFQMQLSTIVERKKLPSKRGGFTQKAKVGGQTLFIRTGEYSDGRLGEIFVDMHKEGATFRSLMNCFSIAVSIGLQYGVPLREFVDKFTFTKFEPAGYVEGHDNIKNATSIIDFIFRLLGFEYLNRNDLVQIPPVTETRDNNIQNTNIIKTPTIAVTKTQTVISSVSMEARAATSTSASDMHLQSMQSDAPACNECGHLTVRSGTCYKCLNCGNSLGCS
jgi:ribonucleoside-diphosphate reductase alpha chain